tara:strand:+ start:64 stop:1413 length:1350 start_codon:yes stop_codon:yes gene_type:complete
LSVQFEELRGKIEIKKAQICIIGLGQVGLPTALSFVNSGFSVTGVDTDEELVNKVNNGIPPFEEENLQEILENSQKNKRFHATTKIEEAIQNSNVIIVCVATPITENNKPDMTHLKIVCDSLANYNLNKKLILIESSLPPGTFEGLILPSIQKSDEICWSCYVPERLVPGHAFNEIKVAPRLIGELNTESGVLAKELYKTIVNAEIVLTTFRVAEISKLVENTYRDVNIALANEIGIICEKYGIDFNELVRVCNSHPRVNLHQPGPGVGGPCLPKDPHLLLNPFNSEQIKSDIILNSRKINDEMPNHVVTLIQRALQEKNKNLENSVISVLGTAYKANVSDVRNSPSEKIIKHLLDFSCKIKVNDPNTDTSFGGLYEKNILKTIEKSDLLVILTDHDEYKKLDLQVLRDIMNENPILVDTKRVFDKKIADDAGFLYVSVGYHSLGDKIN